MMCLLSHASVLFPSDPSRLKWTTGKTKCWGGGGAPTKKKLTEGQQGEHHSACYIGIELGFGVVFFFFLPMVCTLPAGFFFLFCFATYEHF